MSTLAQLANLRARKQMDYISSYKSVEDELKQDDINTRSLSGKLKTLYKRYNTLLDTHTSYVIQSKSSVDSPESIGWTEKLRPDFEKVTDLAKAKLRELGALFT